MVAAGGNGQRNTAVLATPEVPTSTASGEAPAGRPSTLRATFEAMSDGYYNLGDYGRQVTTESAEAQRWFDRGLNWLYGFNHEEAIACFDQVIEADSSCAMAHWGRAIALGPNYNLTWEKMDDHGRANALAAAYEATENATTLTATTNPDLTPAEVNLIHALASRYPQRETIDDQEPWNHDYADAMRKVASAHPDDLDVQAAFVDAILNLTPWQMWDLQTGHEAEGAGTAEARQVLELAFTQTDEAWDHPGLLHYYVHLMEMSPWPELALRHGDRLREMMPDSGHLIHMPTHIDVLCGNYHDVVHWNQKAVEADRRWLADKGPYNIYTFYRNHNHHFVIYGAMFAGQYTAAMAAARELIDTTPEDFLRIESPPVADATEAFMAMSLHVQVRFGKWTDIIAEPLPEDRELYSATTAMTLYAKTLAHSALGHIPEAEATREQFLEAKANVPETRRIHNNAVVDLLEVGEAMIDGELAYRQGQYQIAFAHLRRAVELEDGLAYDEPWGWMQPTRHALGALLLEQQRYAEAEAVYRADLGLDTTLSRACRHPNNLWSLHGLLECLNHRNTQGEDVPEATMISQQLDVALARSEVDVKASCYCHQAALADQ